MSKSKTFGSIAVAVLFSLMVVSGSVFAAAPTLDTSGTDDTTTQTEIQTGTTIANFTANDSKASTVQYVADSNNSKVELRVNGEDYVVYENSSADQVDWNATSGNGNFNVSINHGDLADLERAINSNVTVNMTLVNDTTATTPDETFVEFFIESDNSSTVQNVDDADVDAETVVELTSEEGFSVADFNITSGSDFSEIDQTRDIDGQNTDVVLVFSNDSVASDYSNAVDGLEEGDYVWGAATSLEDTPAVVYYKEAPDHVDEDDDTYGVYKEDIGGQPGIVYNLGDDFEGETTVDITAYGNVGKLLGDNSAASVYGYQTVFFGTDGALSMSGVIFPAGGSLGALGLVAARRETGVEREA